MSLSPRTRAARGFTLVEILIATAIFSILGATIVFFLRQGLATWRAGETKRGAYEEAQAVLRQIRDDLQSAYVREPAILGQVPTAPFICRLDANGRQRLAFVRTLPREAAHPVAALAGRMVARHGTGRPVPGARAEDDLEPRDLDGRDDLAEGRRGVLRATGGLMEVAYFLDPKGGDTLYRGFHAPPGGAASLFNANNVEQIDVVKALCQPFSFKVIDFELAFWTQVTSTWRDRFPPQRAGGPQSGPAAYWDSTRGFLPKPPGGPDDLEIVIGRASLADPTDDIYPERILVTLVVAEEGPAARETILVQPMVANAREARVLSTKGFEARGPFIRIGREWVRVEKFEEGRLVIPRDGRGARGTEAKAHDAGELVVAGVTFTTVIELPSSREDWNP